ncbi:Z1 domain protein [compost metagenome]
MVGAALAQQPLPTRERIRELIQAVRGTPMCSGISDEAAERLALKFEESHGVTMTIGAYLTEAGYEPWLDTARARITPYYWQRYRQLLTQQGFSGQVLATLDDVTNRILGLLENPEREGPWDRRGMVVGHVQSGKTANYAGLICKAADAGYRLIVVIAGVHNNLRNQTQARIDEGFVGRDSAKLLANREDSYIGVGRFDKSRRPVTFTNSLRDFNKAMATGVGVPLQNLNEPAVFVIKKNSSTLKNLLEWLKEHSARTGSDTVDAPMLLIDDEADNASINTKHGKGEVTKINGQIRDLLKMFDRSCYVGYTATPFANIFIDPDSADEMKGADLFPKDFIVSLDPPTNYFGASKVFLDEADKIVREIDDNEDYLPIKHPTDFALATLPPSLIKAVRTFIVARAIRIARGQGSSHCSMLVNASVKNDVQRQLRNEVHLVLEAIQESARVNAALPPNDALLDPEIAALHEAWSDEYANSCGFDWPTIQAALHEAAAPTKTVLINSKSPDTLDYTGHAKAGLSVIAIGGFALSRGLTLEGLVVSYFLRNSMMYDTLMQMGRWFGYRTGYEDLCRIWMPEAALGWYSHIAEATEELREELRSMQAANATPVQFGLKVRSHPDTLIVTARNKMGSGETLRVSIGLGKRFAETVALRGDAEALGANRKAVGRLVARLAEVGSPLAGAERITGGWLVGGVPVELIDQFVAEFQNHPASMLTEPGPVRQYIGERKLGELASWDVLFASLRKSDPLGITDKNLGVEVFCQRRAKGKTNDPSLIRVSNRQRVASRGVEKAGLGAAEADLAEAQYRERTGKTRYPDLIYREIRQRPLLIVHLIALGEEHEDLSEAEPIVAWSISFPPTAMEEKRVEYVVNTTWWRENYQAELDDDDGGGDDD